MSQPLKARPSALVAAFHWLTLPRLVTGLTFVAIFTMGLRALADTDIWWHLQSGRWIVEHRAVPLTDPFSQTRFGQRWIDHGWLAQWLLFLLYDNFGYAGPVLLVAGLVTLAFYFVWRQARDGNRWVVAFTLLLAAVTSAGIWAARPQLFSFVLAALVAYLLVRYKAGHDRAIAWLPLVVLLWVNLHGGFAIAFILMLAYLIGEVGSLLLSLDGIGRSRIARLALVILLCLAVVPLNPNGALMWSYPFQTAGIGALQLHIQEWRSPDFHQLYQQPFIWMLLATLVALGLSGRRADLTELTLVSLFAYLTLLALRNIALFALVTAPVLARYGSVVVEEWWARWRPAPAAAPPRALLAAVNWCLLLLALLATAVRAAQVAAPAHNEAAQARALPAGAIDFLRQNRPPGPLFNHYNWGGYLIWRLPDYPVYVDGRTDLYGDDFLADYLEVITAGRRWQAILDRDGVNVVLIETGSALARLLSADPHWREAYRDQMAVVFTRAAE